MAQASLRDEVCRVPPFRAVVCCAFWLAPFAIVAWRVWCVFLCGQEALREAECLFDKMMPAKNKGGAASKGGAPKASGKGQKRVAEATAQG